MSAADATAFRATAFRATAFRSGTARRDEFMARVPRWYRGWLHFLATNLLGAALLAAAAWGIGHPRPVEIAIVPIAFLVSNFFEWWVHRGPMHHRGLVAILFNRHTLLHHASFSHESMAIRDGRELRMVMFPLPAFFAAAVLAALLGLGAALLWTENAGRLFFLVALGYYLLYEWLHVAYHLPERSLVGGNAVVRRLRRLHARHHDPTVMVHKNFNITFPIADAVLGTLDRGQETKP